MNCIIVDDEPLARKAIQKLVYQTENLEIIASFNGTDATREFLAKNTVDLVFLDIQMPGVNGIEFARTIPKNTLVVFTTAYHEFASESYDVDAIDYLIKPVKLERSKSLSFIKTCEAFLGSSSIKTFALLSILKRKCGFIWFLSCSSSALVFARSSS